HRCWTRRPRTCRRLQPEHWNHQLPRVIGCALRASLGPPEGLAADCAFGQRATDDRWPERHAGAGLARINCLVEGEPKQSFARTLRQRTYGPHPRFFLSAETRCSFTTGALSRKENM